jgi:hypothetical protein
MVRVTELLEDGEWRDIDWIVREAGKVVPPAKAIRVQEATRLKAGGPPVRHRPLSDERRIESGRRYMVRQVLHSMKTSVERDGTRFRLLRLPPRVEYYRKADADGRSFEASRILDQAVASHDPETVWAHRNFKPNQWERLVLEAVRRLQERA